MLRLVNKLNQRVQFLTVTVTATALTVVALLAAGRLFLLNDTASMPEGLYVRVPKHTGSDRKFERGDTVGVCLTDAMTQPYVLLGQARGYLEHTWLSGCSLPGGGRAVPLIKYVVATPGDEVVIVSSASSGAGTPGVYVNGSRVPNSTPLARDSLGRAMPPLNLHSRLSSGWFLVMSPDARSFDSRYFGPVPEEDLVARLMHL
jgi:conjugative transfer signal peptidase TraF